MRYRMIIGELVGTPEQRAAWKKSLEEERKRNREAMESYKTKERLRKQLTLDLGVPKLTLCPECHGMGCLSCRKKGVVEERKPATFLTEEEASVPLTVECRRCWGVGQVASTTFVVKNCPNCGGTGRVEAPID